MSKYVCDICAYEYDPEKGDPSSNIPPETAWADLPATWVCPICGGDKSVFTEIKK